MFRSLSVLLGMATAVCLICALPVWSTDYSSPEEFPTVGSQDRSIVLAASKSKKHKLPKKQIEQPQPVQAMVAPNQMQTLLQPSDTHTSVGNLIKQSAPTTPGFLEIEVSHSTHSFKLIEHTGDFDQVLYECKIGLGSSEFPTPVGVYYVTHIYDDDPWWIPPKDRAWAAGDSPSKRVYGGTMAPLLKKKTVRQKKRTHEDTEDQIVGEVQLDDYGYRFHGTNAPRSIGRNQSHGCVRMISADAKKVANIIKEKTGIRDRREAENGSYAVLQAPVRLNLTK